MGIRFSQPAGHARPGACRLLVMLGPALGCGTLQADPYDPRAAFATLDLPGPINAQRTGAGRPGPAYWQNRVDYEIHAEIHPATHSLSGREIIRYTNHSPEPLEFLWVQLDQNMYRRESRSYAAQGGVPPGVTSGYQISAVRIEQGGRLVPAQFLESDTRLKIWLPTALAASRGQVSVHLEYQFEIPGEFGGRTSWARLKDGEVYDMAQWYPRLAVYDDVRGWDPLPYLDQEFYLEYGDFDYWVTVPATMLVAGSGQLQNPQEVLTEPQRQRLAKAALSDATVAIVTPEDIGHWQDRRESATRTWHFRMQHTRDVAFAASAAFAWDAARINLAADHQALAMSFYPRESAAAWVRSTEYVKHTVENMSRRWFDYPWPVAINVAGPTDGMEYPGIVFNGTDAHDRSLFGLAVHEIGHSWFPMIVGSDERRDAWMDEGFNTFIDTLEYDDFQQGAWGPKRDGEFAPHRELTPAEDIVPLLADPKPPVMVSRADTILEAYRHPVSYFKSALGLKLLREEILGPERFDSALRRFIAAWAYKHPQPSDFFRFMNNESGEDLSWWWRGWYLTNSTYDVAVTGITPARGGGWLIAVENRDALVLPVTLRIEYADSTHEDRHLPAETWIRQSTTQVFVPPGRAVVAVTADPEHALPDHDRSNNQLKAAP